MCKFVHTTIAVAVLLSGFGVCKCFSSVNISEPSLSNDEDAITAVHLAARAQLLQNTDPAEIEVSALLAIESMKRLPSPDADHTLRWAIALLRAPFKRVPHGREISAIALSPDGQWLATASDDNTLHLTAVNSDDKLPPHSHGHRISQIVFSPDGSLIATASKRTVQVFDLHHSIPVQSLTLGGDVVSIAFGREGRLAIGSQDNSAEVIDVRSGRILVRLGIKEQLRLVALDPSAKMLAVSAGSFVHLYDIAAKYELPHSPFKHGGTVRMIAFTMHSDSQSREKDLMATASQDGIARVFRIPSGELLAKWAPNDGFPLTLISFSKRGDLVATADTANVVRVFRVAAECKELSWFRHQGAVTFIGFAAADTVMVTGSADHTARIFEPNSGREIARMIHPGIVVGMGIHEASGTIATASAGLARLFRVSVREPGAVSLGSMIAMARSVFSRNGTIVVSTAKEIHLFNTAGEDLRKTIAIDYPLNALAYSDDGGFIGIATINGIAYLYKDGVPHVIANSNRDPRGAASAASTLAFSSDNALVVLAGNSTNANGQEQAYVHVFNTSTYAAINSPGICPGRAQSVAVSSGQTVAVGTSDRVCIFRADTQSSPLTDESVSALAFSPSGNFIAVGTQRGTVQVFNTTGNEVFHSYPQRDSITTILFLDDERFATLTGRGIARVFDLRKQSLIAWLPQIVRSFTSVNGNLLTLSQDETGLFLQTHQIAPIDLVKQGCSRVSRNLFEPEWRTHVGLSHYQKTCQNLP